MMFTLASGCSRKNGSSRHRETRFSMSSIPQLPPRAAIRTPFTLIARYGVARVSSRIFTAADFSAPGFSEATHDFQLSLHSSGKIDGNGSGEGIFRLPL